MPTLIRSLSRRDAILILLGALSMHFFSTLGSFSQSSIVINTHNELTQQDPTPEKYHGDGQEIEIVVDHPSEEHSPAEIFVTKQTEFETKAASADLPTPTPSNDVAVPVPTAPTGIPQTTIVEHVPGWTLFRDIYMSNGTLFIVSSSPASEFPHIRMMTSTGLEAENTPENIASREPTPWNMDFVTPEEATQRWGKPTDSPRVWTVEGNTLLFNDPSQFLAHYYHFCAELLLGAWSFWTGAAHPAPPPPIDRAIFAHSGHSWRDNPGFNAYFLRAAFPSLTVEVEEDWNDRILATSASLDTAGQRAWHFPQLLLSDRSAAFRGKLCGSMNQRTASESVDGLIALNKLDKQGDWWRPIRHAVWRFAGVTDGRVESLASVQVQPDELSVPLPSPEEDQDKIVITYISRQAVRRRLIPEDHDVLVQALNDLVERKNAETKEARAAGAIAAKDWELYVPQAETMTKDEQVRMAARTTILLGVHGNGLTHLILMPRTRISAVIEMFFPGGFAHDYEWTTRALGMRHFAVWNDTYYTEENTPHVSYPEGFQGTSIPVYGPAVADLIEKRVAGLI
ncbi:hypothetical protein BJ138DRAFT_174726 [Hygrophoropsis aurantiaca]|uniref:Uncharacterized protein n=1 Tax=Hygrophoropsis aurantiaca TaxID=72124 RepID=A0ACB8APK1_9AGAM|nr:hypothetical protein BJ138DRAFT_174726 [Hygrophoropsis aurantiaca]